MINPAYISAGASAVSALGGLLGGGGDSPAKATSKVGQANIENEIKWLNTVLPAKLSKAKQLGIHPLTMLGVQPTSGGSVSTASSPSFGERLAAAGADISRAISAGSSNMEKLQERLLLAQIEGQEIDNVSRASQTARTFVAGTSTAGLPAGERIGNSAVIPRSIFLKDRDGRMTEVLNPDAGDTEMLQFQDYLTRTLPNEFRNWSSRSWDNVKSFGRWFSGRAPSQPYIRGSNTLGGY